MEQEKSERQKQDYELMTNLWHMLRDYGDIRNDDPDADARWIELNKFVDDTVRGIDDNNMTRFCMGRMLQALEDRTLGRQIGEGTKRSKDDLELLDLFHRMTREQKTAVLVLMRMIGGSR